MKDETAKVIHIQRTTEEMIFQVLLNKDFLKDLSVDQLRQIARSAYLAQANFTFKFNKLKNPKLLNDDFYNHKWAIADIVEENALKGKRNE